ncbi:MAG: hypothetical protein ACI8Z7_000063 [Candidatus Nanohaloarchaea archaeon]|jgi:hypothetical protein
MAGFSPMVMITVVLATIVAALVLGIGIGDIRALSDATDNQESEFDDFVEQVNAVCDNEQGVVRGSVQIDNYRINRSQNDQRMLMLVNSNEEIETTSEVNCPVLEEFSIDVDYRIERQDSERAVEIYEDSTSSQIGDLNQ